MIMIVNTPDYDSENFWISEGLFSSNKGRRGGEGRGERESLHLHLRCRAAGLPDLLRDLAGDRAAVIGLSSHGTPAHGCPRPARLVRAVRIASP